MRAASHLDFMLAQQLPHMLVVGAAVYSDRLLAVMFSGRQHRNGTFGRAELYDNVLMSKQAPA